jgi:hypothetical protein
MSRRPGLATAKSRRLKVTNPSSPPSAHVTTLVDSEQVAPALLSADAAHSSVGKSQAMRFLNLLA